MFLFQKLSLIKSYEGNLKIYVKDYINNIIIDNITQNSTSYFYSNEIKEIELNISIDYGSIIEIEISNYDLDYGLSSVLIFNNKTYSTNETFLWKNNDTRNEDNFLLIDTNLNNFTNSYLIGGYDERPSYFTDIRYSYYLYTMEIIYIINCLNEDYQLIKINNENEINFLTFFSMF